MVKPTVFVGVPSGGTWRRELGWYMLRLAIEAQEHVSRVEFGFSDGNHIPFKLNELVKQFMDSRCEWFLKIDSDNPPVRNVLPLTELDCDVICCPTPSWLPQNADAPLVWNVWQIESDGESLRQFPIMEGLQAVDVFGGGCFLVRRKVLETIRDPFSPTVDDDGSSVQGWDHAFCRRVKEAGFQLHAHFDYPCQHIKTVDLLELSQYQMKLQQRYDSAASFPRSDSLPGEHWMCREGELNGLPWMGYGHAARIARYAREARSVLEWGSGGSTLWICSMGRGKFLSVEHDVEWFQRVTARIAGTSGREGEFYFAPDFQDYVDAPRGNEYDLVIVDGRRDWRSACAGRAFDCMVRGATIFIHDSQRDEGPQQRFLERGGEFVWRGFDEICNDGVELWQGRKP